MSNVSLVWATPNGDALIANMARVSNPANQDNPSIDGLINYMLRNGHVSPFEMVNACVEINTTRDIGRQILRHRSFSFQEFCVAGDTKLSLEMPSSKSNKRRVYTRTIEHLYRLQTTGKKMPACARVFDEGARTFVRAGIREVFQTGVKPVFRVALANGRTLDCTKEHKLLTDRGFLSLEEAVGLRVVGGTAAFDKSAMIACNGTPAHRDPEWLAAAKQRAISAGTGLAGIAAEAGVTTHTIRKALRRAGLQFTKQEVAAYTPIWNKGLRGYRLGPHPQQTIQKMRASARRGPESNLWRGGADRRERLKIADWCLANRTDFLRAANYKCARCEASKRLELHHIQPVVERPDLAREPSNIEVLCRACHTQHHGTAGHHKGWRERSRGNTLTAHWSEVVSVVYLGEHMTYDLEVDHASHNYVANGIITHNSQRYAEVGALGDPEFSPARMQDTKNRQNSLESADHAINGDWLDLQSDAWEGAMHDYRLALSWGVAKELARKLLPEGLTPTRMYMNGTLRSWIHYLQSRLDPSTQKEHREVAESVRDRLLAEFPVTLGAALEITPAN